MTPLRFSGSSSALAGRGVGAGVAPATGLADPPVAAAPELGTITPALGGVAKFDMSVFCREDVGVVRTLEREMSAQAGSTKSALTPRRARLEDL